LQATQSTPEHEPAPVVSAPTAEEGGLLVVAVRDGQVELDEAVLLRGSAARLFVELGEDLSARRMAQELTRQGAGDAAVDDSRHFHSQLARSGLVPGDPGAEVAVDPRPGRITLEAVDIERLVRAVLEGGHSLRYRALGRSMRPAIPHGSTLEVVARPFADVRVGEVALYSAADGARLVAHRVRSRRRRSGGDLLVTRGDSSTRTDLVRREEYLGVVTRRIAPDGDSVAVSEGSARWLGLCLGSTYRCGAVAARVLVVEPLRRTYAGRSLVRASLGAVLRVGSGVLLRLERIGRRARRPLDVARAALLTTREKDDDRRGLYARRVVQRFTSLDENLVAGLTPIEETLLSRHPLGTGRVLVLGCGPGRESVALAERGHEVTGLDREEGMLADARSFAARRGVEVRFVVGDALEFQVDGAPFDAVVIFSGLVNMILPSARRVRALACSFEHLGPGGRVLVTFLSAYRGQNEAPPPASRGFWHAVNPEHEPGDHYLLNETVHVYRCAEELCDEAVEAGFEVEVVHRDQRAYDKADGLVRGYAVFRKPG